MRDHDGHVGIVGRPDGCPGPPDDDRALQAAVRRAEDALRMARVRIAAHGQRTTTQAHAALVRAGDEAHLRALEQAAAIETGLRAALRAATASTRDGAAAVPVGSVRVRRHAEATATVRVPLLVPTARVGVRIVGGEDAMPTVLTLAAVLAANVVHRDRGKTEPVVVVNPRRRALPDVLLELPGLREVHDGRSLLGAVAHEAAGGLLLVLDYPHDLGLAGRRLVHAATVDHPFRALVVHHAADDRDVDREHRRLRTSRTGVPHPTGGCELWPARGGWRWSAHPQLRIDLPGAPSEPGVSWADGVGAGCSTGPGSTVGPGEEEGDAVTHGPSAPRDVGASSSVLDDYERLLDRIAGVAHDLDEALAAARADERRALDHAAAVRRGTLAAIDVEDRAIGLLLRRVGCARSPPPSRPAPAQRPRTAPPRGDPVAATDLVPLRAARAALARAVDPARRSRDG